MKTTWAFFSLGLFSSSLTIAATPDYFAQIEVEKAWDITRGHSQVSVAIVGTGVNYHLPEIAAVVKKNAGEYGDGKEHDGLDNDKNGYIDDVWGANTLIETNDPSDVYGLGTHSASIIASQTYGIAPSVTIIPIALTSPNGSSDFEAMERALRYAAQRGATLVQLGLGGGKDHESLKRACDVIKSIQIPVIAPAGNEHINLDEMEGRSLLYPADCDAENLIVVGSTDNANELSYFSNYGADFVDIAAPGTKIVGFGKEGEEQQYTGTSIASSVATGVAALIMSIHPEYSPTQLKSALISSSDEFSSLAGKILSGGRINAFKAVSSATTN